MKALITVWVKELREFLRDRKTAALALLLGPILTPALLIGMFTLVDKKTKSQIEKPMSIVIVGSEYAPNLVTFLSAQGIALKKIPGNPDDAIRAQDEDVYLKIHQNFAQDWREGTPALVEIVHDSTRQDANIPVRRLEAALEAYGRQVGALRLLARGVNPRVAAPIALSHTDLSTPEARKGMIMSFLPYLFILSAFLGGAYLIIDATAGERERQSLEPLLATPASRSSIVSGKITAASTVGMTSLLLTLLALKLGAQFAPGIASNLDVTFVAMAKMLLVLAPMVFIGTTLLTYIAAGSKSVKEAQSYMSVLMLLPMIPTIILMVSPVKEALWQFAIPFLAQNQMLMKVVRTETITPIQWLVYCGAGFGLAAVLWFAATRRYHQERLAISA